MKPSWRQYQKLPTGNLDEVKRAVILLLNKGWKVIVTLGEKDSSLVTKEGSRLI